MPRGGRSLDAQPLAPVEAEALLQPGFAGAGMVLAVSGGPDSTALMHLAAEVGGTLPHPPMHVATVDHGLRDGSRAEAEAVCRTAAALGFSAHILTWEGPKPVAGVQDAARRVRYALLETLSDRLGASHLLTAHTLDDQAETVMFRMARGSGVAGLGGMRPIARRGSVVHLRPFLAVPKNRLVASCEARGWPFLLDPANEDMRYARGRWRALMPLLAAEGLDARRIAQLADRLRVAEAAISAKAADALDACHPFATEHGKTLRLTRLMDEPGAVILHVLGSVLTGFAHAGRPPLGRLETAVTALVRAHVGGVALRRTLHGAVLDFSPPDRLVLSREPPRTRGVKPGTRR